jgi:hypothetical protein
VYLSNKIQWLLTQCQVGGKLFLSVLISPLFALGADFELLCLSAGKDNKILVYYGRDNKNCSMENVGRESSRASAHAGHGKFYDARTITSNFLSL